MELTMQEVREKEKELKDVEEDLKIALAQQQEAKSLGDFSENSELDIATTKVRELQARKVVLLEQLSDYTVVKPNKSRRIVLGDYVEFVKLDNNNQPISEVRKMRLAREGIWRDFRYIIGVILKGKIKVRILLRVSLLNQRWRRSLRRTV